MLSNYKILLRIEVDLINISPLAPLNAWKYFFFFKNLRLFGCGTYVHIYKDERLKLYDKDKLCIFLG